MQGLGIVAVSAIPISSMLKLNDDTKNNNVIILDKNKTAADAVSVMKEKSVRCILVADTENNNIVGFITKMEKAIVQMENAFNKGSSTPLCIMNPLASLHIKEKSSLLVCPHCKTEYSKKELLTKHVKDTHADSDALS